MATEEMMLVGDRFIKLDVLNTKSENEFAKACPSVQIVDPSNMNSYQNIKEIKSRVGSVLKLEEKRNHLFTVTLNIEADYETQLFR